MPDAISSSYSCLAHKTVLPLIILAATLTALTALPSGSGAGAVAAFVIGDCDGRGVLSRRRSSGVGDIPSLQSAATSTATAAATARSTTSLGLGLVYVPFLEYEDNRFRGMKTVAEGDDDDHGGGRGRWSNGSATLTTGATVAPPVVSTLQSPSDSAIGQAALVQLFALADSNGDGKLDESELARASDRYGFSWLKENGARDVLAEPAAAAGSASIDRGREMTFVEFAKAAPMTLKLSLINQAKKSGGFDFLMERYHFS